MLEDVEGADEVELPIELHLARVELDQGCLRDTPAGVIEALTVELAAGTDEPALLHQSPQDVSRSAADLQDLVPGTAQASGHVNDQPVARPEPETALLEDGEAVEQPPVVATCRLG